MEEAVDAVVELGGAELEAVSRGNPPADKETERDVPVINQSEMMRSVGKTVPRKGENERTGKTPDPVTP